MLSKVGLVAEVVPILEQFTRRTVITILLPLPPQILIDTLLVPILLVKLWTLRNKQKTVALGLGLTAVLRKKWTIQTQNRAMQIVAMGFHDLSHYCVTWRTQVITASYVN